MLDDDPASELSLTAGLGSSALRNTVIVLTAKVVARVVALVTIVATLNHLGAVQYGTFTTLVNYTAIGGVLLDLGFNVLYVREGARHPSEIQRYLRNVMSLRIPMAVASLALLAVALSFAGLGGLLAPAFATMILTSYSTLLRNTLYAVQRLGYEGFAVILESLVLLTLVLVGIKAGQGVVFFIWAYAAQFAFSCVYFAIVLAVKRIAIIGWQFETDLLWAWFWRGLPFALTFVLTVLYFRVDQPIIYALRSHVEAGWYGAAFKPYEALLFVPMTLLSVVFPVLSVYHRERPNEQIIAVGRFFKALFLIGWPTTVGLFVLAHTITDSLRLYPQSEPALRILALALVTGFVNNAFIAALSASDRQLSFTWAAMWSLLANVGLNLALVPSFGYLAASWAAVLTEMVLAIAGWVLTARYIGRLPVAQLTWRALLAGLVMGAFIYPARDLEGLAIAIPILGGVGVYVLSALMLRAVTADEIRFAWRAIRFGK